MEHFVYGKFKEPFSVIFNSPLMIYNLSEPKDW